MKGQYRSSRCGAAGGARVQAATGQGLAAGPAIPGQQQLVRGPLLRLSHEFIPRSLSGLQSASPASTIPKYLYKTQRAAAIHLRLLTLNTGNRAAPGRVRARRFPPVAPLSPSAAQRAPRPLARFSHTTSAARRDKAASTSLRLLAVLNVLSQNASARQAARASYPFADRFQGPSRLSPRCCVREAG